MKKLLLLLAIGCMALGLVCCGGQNPPEPEVPAEPEVPEGTTLIKVARVQVQPMGTCIAYMLYDDESGKAFVYPLLLQQGEEDVEPGKTYVFPGEMNKAYAYWMLSDYTTHALYTEATFKKTLKNDTLMRIDATASDTNGDKWMLVFDQN